VTFAFTRDFGGATIGLRVTALFITASGIEFAECNVRASVRRRSEFVRHVELESHLQVADRRAAPTLCRLSNKRYGSR
jgi:hypothetical protein